MSKQYTGVYSIATTGTFSGARELIGLTAASDRGIEIIRAEFGLFGSTSPPDEMLRSTMGPVTSSGDGAPSTERPFHPNYPTASAVGTQNGASVHTLQTLLHFGFHIQQGILYLPDEDERMAVAGGDEWGWNLVTGPAASQSFSWHIVWGEL